MPRGCGCAGNSCGCLVVAGPGITVTGTGNASDPVVVSRTASVTASLGPYSVETTINFTGTFESDSIIDLEIEHNVYVLFSTTAPIGTRYDIRTHQSFGAKVIPTGNIYPPVGVLQGVAPDRYFPIPTNGQAWISALKVSSYEWLVTYVDLDIA